MSSMEKEVESKDALRNKLFSLTQSSFPLVHAPYLALSEELGLSEKETYELMKKAREDGSVRRLGPVFDSYRLGYVSCLCACKVSPERVDECAKFINRYHNVTHNYLRKNDFNLWFTVIAHGTEELERIIASIEQEVGSPVLRLPATKLFKIKVDFNLSGEKREAFSSKATVPKAVAPFPLNETDIALIRLLQESDFEGLHPYEKIAPLLEKKTGIPVSEEEVLQTLQTWKEARVIRRFGITVRHHKVGMTSNVMVVWNVDDTETERAGEIMARQEEVSHCYERPRFSDWPNNLYTMVHGTTPQACDQAICSIKNNLMDAGIVVEQPQLLHTLSELKKTSMKYFYEEIA